MRLFIAIDVEGEAKAKVLELVGRLASACPSEKFTKPGNLHFTLKFLGEVEEKRIPEIKHAMGEVARLAEPFTLHVQGMGWFGSKSFPKVVWIGAGEGSSEFARIAGELEKRLSGFRKEEHEPKPHLTICRPSGTTGLVKEVEKLRGMDFRTMQANSMKLKKSTLSGDGAVYEDVGSFRLGS